MKILVWIGIPYNQWYEWDKKPVTPSNPFENFIINKGDFQLSFTTMHDGSVEIKVKLPYHIVMTI